MSLAIPTLVIMLRPMMPTFRPWFAAASMICWIRWILLERWLPRSCPVPQQKHHQRPGPRPVPITYTQAAQQWYYRTSAAGHQIGLAPQTGGDPLPCRQWASDPAQNRCNKPLRIEGVWTTIATTSAMLWLTWINSTFKAPTLTLPPALTSRRSTVEARPCSSISP